MIIFQTNLTADVPSYLDFKYILNQSEAGKSSRFFKKKLDNGVKALKKKEKALQEEEKKLYNKKSSISRGI